MTFYGPPEHTSRGGLRGLFGQGPRRSLHVWPPVKSANGHSSPPLFGPCLLWPRSTILAVAELLLSYLITMATTDMSRKWGGGCAPLREGELGPHLTQCDEGRRLPACQEPFGHRTPTSQTDRTNRTNSTDRTTVR